MKQRICGKSLPQEKFAITKVDRLARQGGRLALPGLELVYVWNGFNIIGRSPRLVEAMLELVNEEKERLKNANGKSHFPLTQKDKEYVIDQATGGPSSPGLGSN